jgi:hypothetical protein
MAKIPFKVTLSDAEEMPRLHRLFWGYRVRPIIMHAGKEIFCRRTAVAGPVGLTLFVLAACDTRDANPVQIYRQSDHQMSCPKIAEEQTFIEGEIARLLPESDKRDRNMVLAVIGGLLATPFIDLSDVERIEMNAYKDRYERLDKIAEKKDCPRPETPLLPGKSVGGDEESTS